MIRSAVRSAASPPSGQGLAAQRRHPGALGIGVGDEVREAGTLEDQGGPVLLLGPDDLLRALEMDVGQLHAQAHVLLGGDPAGAAVGDHPALHRAEVDPRRQVFGAQLYPHAQRRENPPSHLEAHRIVSEESHVSGAAARGYPRGDGVDKSTGGIPGQRIQVGGARRLQFGETGVRMGQATQPVQDQQHHLGRRLSSKLGQKRRISQGSTSSVPHRAAASSSM